MKDWIIFANVLNVIVNLIGILLTARMARKTRERLNIIRYPVLDEFRIPELDDLENQVKKSLKTSLKFNTVGIAFMIFALSYSLNILYRQLAT